MDSRIKQIFEHFGLQTQKAKLNEELNELSMAVKNSVKTDVIDEISDCYIVIAQFMHFHNIKLTDIIERVDYKLDRTIERIESGYYEGEK